MAQRMAFRIALCVGLTLSPVWASAYTITIGSPTVGSNWSVGANMACSGAIGWRNNPPMDIQMRPTSGIVYLHAGSNQGVVANSKTMTISNIGNSSEDWTAELEVKASNPPIGPGGGVYVVYYLQACGQVARNCGLRDEPDQRGERLRIFEREKFQVRCQSSPSSGRPPRRLGRG